jgi:tetratricopeptide (TPR) repeat protein
LRASAYIEQGAYALAETDLDRVAAIDPANSQASTLRGLVYLKDGQYERAVAALSEALTRSPEAARTYFLRGSAFQSLEQHDKALDDFHQAVLRDPAYTAAYSNQRAFLHAAAGEYDLALADYAIVLQLDPHNVTALVGRELALQARAARTVEEKTTSATQLMARQRATQTHMAIPTQEALEELAPVTESADSFEDFELIPGDDEPAPTPTTDASVAESTSTTVSDPTPAAGGPYQARVAREQQQTETSERARLWAEMRYRERRTSLEKENRQAQQEAEPRERSPWVGRMLKAALAATILLAGGSSAYYFFQHREVRLTAEEAWQEYARDTKGASDKYKGRFVQITGKVTVPADAKITRLAFESPKEAKWHIEFALRPDEMKTIKAGQQITIRGRFGPRKNPEANLMLSNCNLLKND